MQITFLYKDFRSDPTSVVGIPEQGISFDVWLSNSELTSALTTYDPESDASVPEGLSKAILKRILDSFIQNS